MPVYQYACTECGQDLEVRQSFTDDALTVCPACNGRLRKVLSAVGVVFKGSGFYRTDSRDGASARDGADRADGKSSSDGSDTAKTGATEKSADSPKPDATGAPNARDAKSPQPPTRQQRPKSAGVSAPS